MFGVRFPVEAMDSSLSPRTNPSFYLTSESESLYGRQSVSQSICLVVAPILSTFDQIVLPFQEFSSGICCPYVEHNMPHSLEIRQMERNADHSSPCSIDAKNVCLVFSLRIRHAATRSLPNSTAALLDIPSRPRVVQLRCRVAREVVVQAMTLH
jgi:hypothetical protein